MDKTDPLIYLKVKFAKKLEKRLLDKYVAIKIEEDTWKNISDDLTNFLCTELIKEANYKILNLNPSVAVTGYKNEIDILFQIEPDLALNERD